jgi:hypothetical protein
MPVAYECDKIRMQAKYTCVHPFQRKNILLGFETTNFRIKEGRPPVIS